MFFSVPTFQFIFNISSKREMFFQDKIELTNLMKMLILEFFSIKKSCIESDPNTGRTDFNWKTIDIQESEVGTLWLETGKTVSVERSPSREGVCLPVLGLVPSPLELSFLFLSFFLRACLKGCLKRPQATVTHRHTLQHKKKGSRSERTAKGRTCSLNHMN